MSCAYPQWRLPESALQFHRLYSRYEKRIHNKGIIMQRPEFESLQSEEPWLASQADEIPCGKCIQCRLNYSREWANRCMLELKTSVNAYFITLTYDDKHLTFSPYVDIESGEAFQRPVLVPSDFQKFMKRLRFWCSEYSDMSVRFYACGEYGETTSRPHYHAIIYNLPPEFEEDRHIFDKSVDGSPLFTCRALSKLWPFGVAVYGAVTWSTCAYVARYVMKKKKGKSRQDQKLAQDLLFPDKPWQEEFTRMSRRPAIGKDYYVKNSNLIYHTDECFVTCKGVTKSVKPCRYYDKLYDIDNPVHLKRLKLTRKQIAKLQHLDRMSRTDLTDEEYNLMKEQSKHDQAMRLVRPKI